MERGAYLKKLQGGMKEWPGVQIMLAATRIGGTWANWYDTRFKCGGFNAKDFFCVKQLDDQENRLAVLRKEVNDLTADRNRADADLSTFIQGLSAGGT